jgi:hypothetical protein
MTTPLSRMSSPAPVRVVTIANPAAIASSTTFGIASLTAGRTKIDDSW